MATTTLLKNAEEIGVAVATGTTANMSALAHAHLNYIEKRMRIVLTELECRKIDGAKNQLSENTTANGTRSRVGVAVVEIEGTIGDTAVRKAKVTLDRTTDTDPLQVRGQKISVTGAAEDTTGMSLRDTGAAARGSVVTRKKVPSKSHCNELTCQVGTLNKIRIQTRREEIASAIARNTEKPATMTASTGSETDAAGKTNPKPKTRLQLQKKRRLYPIAAKSCIRTSKSDSKQTQMQLQMWTNTATNFFGMVFSGSAKFRGRWPAPTSTVSKIRLMPRLLKFQARLKLRIYSESGRQAPSLLTEFLWTSG